MTPGRRRQLLITAGSAALASLAAMHARLALAQTTMPRVVLVLPGTAQSQAVRAEAIRQQLRALGYVDGKNLTLDVREIDSRFERLPVLMKEIVQTRPQAILVSGSQAVRAAMTATTEIPIITITVGQPVEQGFAVSLARPGKNVTGNALIEGVSDEKSVEIIHEFVPKGTRIAFLDDPANPVGGRAKRFQAAATKRKLTSIFVNASNAQEMPAAFASAVAQKAQMMVVANTALFATNPKATVDLAAKHRLPAIYANDAYVSSGSLVIYGYNNSVMERNAAVFVDRILKGRKAAELPFEQPTQFELVVNLKTAKSLGLTVPQTVLVRADRVIE